MPSALPQQLLLRQCEAVVTARRAVGQKAQSAREAADCSLAELAAKLNMSDQELAAFEAGCAVERANVAKISRVLGSEVRAKWSGETEKLNNCNKVLRALHLAREELGNLQRQLSITAMRFKDEAASVQAFDDAVGAVESCRMLALKRARGKLPAARLGDLLTDSGARTSRGNPVREQAVYQRENPDREDPRRPEQAYVNVVIAALTNSDATRSAALDDLRVVDQMFRALDVIGSEKRVLRRWRPPSQAASPIDIVAHTLSAVGVPAGNKQASIPPAVPIAQQAPIPSAVPTPRQVLIAQSNQGGSRRRAVEVATVASVAAVVVTVLIKVFLALSPPCAVKIAAPSNGADVPSWERVAGRAAGCGGRFLWLISAPEVSHAYHPQQQVVVSAGKWSGHVYVGNQRTPVGVQFALQLVSVSADGNRALTAYLDGLPRRGPNPFPGLQVLPADARVLAQVMVTRE